MTATETEWTWTPMWHGQAESCLCRMLQTGMGGEAGRKARTEAARFRAWVESTDGRVETVDGQLLGVRKVGS